MRIRFDSLQDEHEGFEILVELGDVFTYLGNRWVSINHRQYNKLKEKKVVFDVDKREGELTK